MVYYIYYNHVIRILILYIIIIKLNFSDHLGYTLFLNKSVQR